MKIICKKGCNVKSALQIVSEYMEKKSLEYPLIGEDLEIEISLKNQDGEEYPDNDQTVYFDEKELELLQSHEKTPDYYNIDALTGLYNRGKYERDIRMFQATGYERGYERLTCVYMDVVGLHEVNNHLGHEAGDKMLCMISDAIREYFPKSLAYRIGGDEFVVLCPDHGQEEVLEKVSSLRQAIRQQDYEVSIGIGESTDTKTLNEIINYAENAMRYDKADFYRNNGGLRQMRSLNYKLEQLLLKKRDANHFLDVIAPRYKGVYMVNPKTDQCRYIYVPPYFQDMLDRNKGSFIPSMREYYHALVRPEYYDRFETILDYHYIQEKLASEGMVTMTYEKLDDSWVELKITAYDQSTADTQELLWIFIDEKYGLPTT